MSESTSENGAPMLPRTKKIWMDGEFVDWEDATTHVLSHVIHYGSSVFEGIRCYSTPKGPAYFRLDDHMRRLLFSAKTYRMDVPYSRAELCQAARDLIKVNELESCYLRPIIFRGLGQLGINPLNCPVNCVIAGWPWGAYFAGDAQDEGIDVCISSWQRPGPNTLPLLAKAGANYLNSQLVKLEAMANGYHEGIALDVDRYVSEGSGENVFMVVDDGLVTPPSSASVLPGITRHTVITLARQENIKDSRQMIPREGLYHADEVFLTGTAAEVTPVRSVDRLPVGDGKVGPVTKLLREKYHALVSGQIDDPKGWLDYVQ